MGTPNENTKFDESSLSVPFHSELLGNCRSGDTIMFSEISEEAVHAP